MPITKVIGQGLVAFTIAVAPLAGVTLGVTDVAFAKGGNGNGGSGGGNGNGGGHGNGNGGGSGNGGSHSSGASSSRGKSDDARSSKARGKMTTGGTPTLQSLFGHSKKSGKSGKTQSTKTAKTSTASVKSTKSEMAGLSSLNRNYHAYLHSNDPRMAAVSAYAMAYAEFEKVNGIDAIPADPALSDEALREALAGFTKGGVVTDAALAKAKDILGVGPAVGKIDQIRDTLPEPEPVVAPTEPTTDETSDTTTDGTSETTTDATSETTTTVTVTSETTTATVDPAN